jgi:ribosomal protein S18 acetylase RimI-like enzyme
MEAGIAFPGAGWTVRVARPADAAQLVNILDVVGAERWFIANDSASWTVADQRRIIEGLVDHAQRILVADFRGAVVGSLELVRGRLAKNGHTANLAMAILPSYRGIGIGTRLMEEAHSWARAVGIEKICLSVFATNQTAIGLYRKMGYQVEGTRVGQFQIDHALVDELLMAYFLHG